ncbi:mycofactocin-coupled SDR family oxidoreductase [Pseudonocardia hydrocarbonoxydans]|uniref:3-ketoacyl-ACP reductase n=1 Tax=Pseudonocardia hydrocarbonoxydans TaxID=76726 RepID=A0A4Y3WV60_9PSEU|nr:mycofactocin-coupled SDR family oxidoreductase [Pseudonocardia hydrocarbonoxydans]GEC22654.1 3-ketoacyl-ACP reductase [Pseudonocardia hydrocarbonoxydans]
MAGRLQGPGRLTGKVAFVSGAARGQGRSHALRLAQEGADVIAFDVCRQLASVPYPMATPDDLKETVRQVEELDRRIVAREADVRDSDALAALVAEGVGEFGRLDVVCANAGIATFAENAWSITDESWDEMIAVNLTGVWRTVKAAVPAMIDAGNGGSIVITSSTAGVKGMAGIGHYSAAKHGVVGLMRTLANELAPHSIRVNTVHPTGVNTPMVVNDFMAEFLAGSDMSANMQNALPVEMVEAVDISNAVVWLSSDEARYVTGVSLPVDAGFLQK